MSEFENISFNAKSDFNFLPSPSGGQILGRWPNFLKTISYCASLLYCYSIAQYTDISLKAAVNFLHLSDRNTLISRS